MMSHLAALETTAFKLREVAHQQAEDNESLQGDILNGVGSASSHASTGSSVFSVPQHSHMSTHGGSRNPSDLTPLTNTDFSSPSRMASPNQYKPNASISTATETSNEAICDEQHTSDVSSVFTGLTEVQSRVYARDPNRTIKGLKCTYDSPLSIERSPRMIRRKRNPHTKTLVWYV